jgi:uncharacterized protein
MINRRNDNMGVQGFRLLTVFLTLAVLFATAPAAFAGEWGPQRLTFAGGPPGGNFDEVAKDAISRINTNFPQVAFSYSISGGSVENLRRINSGQADLGIVYSGDIFLGRVGRLPFDPRTYEQVLALTTLYTAPAQLMVRANSDITSVDHLAGKRIAVGGIGSGAAAAAQRYFTSQDLWDRIKPEFVGYQDAISSLGHGYVDAILVFSGLPNSTVVQAARSYPIRLLHLVDPAEQADFLTQYPFFTPFVIPAGTYPGIDEPVKTFADNAILVAGAHVEAELVEKILEAAHTALDRKPALFVEKGELITPLHPGAKRFWQAREQR